MCACKYNGRKMASQKREMTLVDHGEQRNKFSLCNAHSPQGNGEWIASFLIRSKRVWNVYPISIYRYIRIVHAEKSLLSIRLGENKRRAISRCFLYRSQRTVSEIWSSIHQILRSIPYTPPLPALFIFVCQFQEHNFVGSLPPLALQGFYVVSSCFLSFF